MHLQAIAQRLVEVGLKLKPAKCRFALQELEYLGHVVNREGLKMNPRLVAAVQEFLIPQTVHGVRRFLKLVLWNVHCQPLSNCLPTPPTDLQGSRVCVVARVYLCLY